MKQPIEKQTRLAMVVGLAMALGPLTALSLGSMYAGEDAWQRASAGLEQTQPRNPFAAYDTTAQVPAYARGKTLLDVAQGSGTFESFEAAVKAAGLEDMLANPGAYTLFVPTDEAFAKLPAERREALAADPQALRDLLKAHMVAGRLSVTDLMRAETAQTLKGQTLPLSTRGDVRVADARVIATEIAENGVVHVIDAVL